MPSNKSLPHQHTARKRFGQNFLHDPSIIHDIIQAIQPTAADNLLEIGPGLGALTKDLLRQCPSLSAVELDRDLIPKLQTTFAEYPDFTIHQGDALQFDFSRLGSQQHPLRLVGNLPYNISTPLLFHLLASKHIIADMHFMLQKEVVDRLVAQPHSKNYGRLSVMVQYYCVAEPLLAVPPTAFKPEPKVDSAIVRLVPYKKQPLVAKDEAQLSRLVKQAFSQRRKTIRNTLKDFITDDTLTSLSLEPSLRAENLTVGDFVNISNSIT